MADLKVNTNLNAQPVDTSIKSSTEVKNEETEVKEKSLLSEVENDEFKTATTNEVDTVVSEELIQALDESINQAPGSTENANLTDNEVKEDKNPNQKVNDEKSEIDKEIEKKDKEKSDPVNYIKHEEDDNIKKSDDKKSKNSTEIDREAKQEINVTSRSGKNTKGVKTTVKLVKNENGKWQAVRPNTPEYNSRDLYMKNAKMEYLKGNPEPDFSSDEAKDSESAEHSKWNSAYKKHMQQLEKDYQNENADYQEQYFAYRKAKLKAEAMNAKLK